MNFEIFESFLDELRNYVYSAALKGKKVISYDINPNPSKLFRKMDIKVELDKHKEIILQEETRLELGGVNKKSFSMIYPFSNPNYIKKLHNGRITLLGLEKNEITESSIDFGMIILIGCQTVSDENWDSLRQLSLFSNGIEGFLIRTIPRKFWCRISTKIINNFTFDFLGNAIYYLYKQKFLELINSIEIFFVNKYSNLIDDFIEIISKINNFINEKWLKKIENWKKRIDCEYDWGCEICPYQEECYDIKQVLVEREKIGK